MLKNLLTSRKLAGVTMPSRKMRYPASYNPAHNGMIHLLTWVSCFLPGWGLGQMHPNASRSWRCMQFVLWGQTGGYSGGRSLTATSPADCFRPLDMQISAWNQRMTRPYNPVTCTTTKKLWKGVWYWLRRGYAGISTPGNSNHGNLLAIDVGIWTEVKPGVFKVVALQNDPVAFNWMRENAPKYGWFWNVASEKWHIEFCLGDEVPQAVLDAEAMIGPMPVGGV